MLGGDSYRLVNISGNEPGKLSEEQFNGGTYYTYGEAVGYLSSVLTASGD